MSTNITALTTGPSTNSLATGLAQANKAPLPPTPNPDIHQPGEAGTVRMAFNTRQIKTLRKPAPSFREFFQGARFPNTTQGLSVPN